MSLLHLSSFDSQGLIHLMSIVCFRCTYNSTGRDRETFIGATADDEMCNLERN